MVLQPQLLSITPKCWTMVETSSCSFKFIRSVSWGQHWCHNYHTAASLLAVIKSHNPAHQHLSHLMSKAQSLSMKTSLAFLVCPAHDALKFWMWEGRTAEMLRREVGLWLWNTEGFCSSNILNLSLTFPSLLAALWQTEPTSKLEVQQKEQPWQLVGRNRDQQWLLTLPGLRI